MQLSVSRPQRSGRLLRLTVRVAPHSGTVSAVASERGLQVSLRIERLNASGTVITLGATLTRGRWGVTVTGKPASGFAAPAPDQLTVTMPR